MIEAWGVLFPVYLWALLGAKVGVEIDKYTRNFKTEKNQPTRMWHVNHKKFSISHVVTFKTDVWRYPKLKKTCSKEMVRVRFNFSFHSNKLVAGNWMWRICSFNERCIYKNVVESLMFLYIFRLAPAFFDSKMNFEKNCLKLYRKWNQCY